MSEIRALSIRQPWASLILSGHKPVENRTWTTAYRGPMVVHAGQATVRAGLEWAAEHGIPVDLERGYLGLVDLVDIHEAHGCCGLWGLAEHYHWNLARPRRLAAPIAGRGRLGLYRPPAEVLDQLTMSAMEASVSTDTSSGNNALSDKE